MTDEEHDAWMDESMQVVSSITGIEPGNIFTRQRQRKAGRQGQYEKIDASKTEFIVEENGLKFRVNLSDYVDTGLFLDHRITREMVRKESANRRVLNLFCYTGSFSVYAAAGDASEIISIDLSKTYLQWAEENMRLNGFRDPKKYKYVHADVMQYLKNVNAAYFDLIVLDPPTFSNSKRMDDFLDIQRDHVYLINSCLTALRTEGTLYFSTNYSKFILESEKIATDSIQDITRLTTPFDFEGKLDRFCFRIKKG